MAKQTIDNRLAGRTAKGAFLSTAPQKRKSHRGFLFLFSTDSRQGLRVEPFCESKMLCHTRLGQRQTRWQRTTLITSERGAPPKAQFLSTAPQRDNYAERINARFFCMFDGFIRSKIRFFDKNPCFWRPFWRPHFNIVFPL